MADKKNNEVTLYVDQGTQSIIEDINKLLSDEIEAILDDVIFDYNQEIEDNIDRLKSDISLIDATAKDIKQNYHKTNKEYNATLQSIEEVKKKMSTLNEVNKSVKEISSQTKKIDLITDDLNQGSNKIILEIEQLKKSLNNSLNEVNKELDKEITKKFKKTNETLDEIKQEHKRIKEELIDQKNLNKIPGFIQFFFGSNVSLWLENKINSRNDKNEQETNYN